MIAVGDTLYVTDGGRNLVWRIDLLTGAISTLVTFPDIPNPLFGIPSRLPRWPDSQCGSDGYRFFDDRLLVTLFRGVPFPAGTSTVQQIDPLTGSDSSFITGRKTAIDILIQ